MNHFSLLCTSNTLNRKEIELTRMVNWWSAPPNTEPSIKTWKTPFRNWKWSSRKHRLFPRKLLQRKRLMCENCKICSKRFSTVYLYFAMFLLIDENSSFLIVRGSSIVAPSVKRRLSDQTFSSIVVLEEHVFCLTASLNCALKWFSIVRCLVKYCLPV